MKMQYPEDYSLVPDEFLFFEDRKGRVSQTTAGAVVGADSVGKSRKRKVLYRNLRTGDKYSASAGERLPVPGTASLRGPCAGDGVCSSPSKTKENVHCGAGRLKEWVGRQYRCRGQKSHVHDNTYDLLDHDPEDCTQAARLWKKALNCVRHLAAELDVEPVKDLPPSIRCGELRTAVEGTFPSGGTLQFRLSTKTTQKLERSCCRSCEPRFAEKLETWREGRFQPQEVDDAHVRVFKKQILANVPLGWNRLESPYIPNGNASLGYKRREGGNWNDESFSRACRSELVFSSGKPRVVTVYSSYNCRVLAPLHSSLQRMLERHGWLLVGPPTADRVNALNGEGDYLSFDFISATDNFKQPYVSAAVDALIERAQPRLDDDQIRCLKVLAELRLDEDGPIATRGQPMGSLMSFPLLCLFNKTMVDLALAEMLEGGQISFKEWTSHRSLVNGDDLLTRDPHKDPREGRSLADAIYRVGSKIGMESNPEKTLRHRCDAEINSTLFSKGELVKKVNTASLYMKPEVNDVLGFALESTTSAEGFRRVVRANARFLARQTEKGYRHLPLPLQRLCKRDRKIRAALTSGPAESVKSEAVNFFPICPRPEGYDLSVREEVQLIHERVDRVRARAIELRKLDKGRPPRPCPVKGVRSWRSVKYEKKPTVAEDSILEVLASGWGTKQKRLLVEQEAWNPPLYTIHRGDGPAGLAGTLVDAIKAFRSAETIRCEPITLALAELPFAEFSQENEVLGDYVRVSG